MATVVREVERKYDVAGGTTVLDAMETMTGTSGVIASLLLGFAKWINADVRTPQYFLQLACVLVSGLLFGVLMGSGFSVLLCLWRWHKATRLGDNQTER